VSKILITGGTGFLGSHLIRRLLAENSELIILKRSFSKTFRIENELLDCQVYNLDELPLSKIFRENQISTIFHCATDYGTSSNVKDIVEANLLLPLELCRLSIENEVRYFINTDTVLEKRINAYALSKKQFSEWMTYFTKNNLILVNIALEHFYGPFDNKTKFVAKLISEILEGVDRIKLTPGKQKRDFIYIDDVIDAFLTIYDNLNTFNEGVHQFEVGTNCNTTIQELALKVKSIAGNLHTYLDFGALPYREYELMESQVDTSALHAMGWRSRVLLKDGLNTTIKMELDEKRKFGE
jgi:nucleoside-diphosphate-sugar epimerase